MTGLPGIRGVLSTLDGEEYVVCSQAGLHLGGQGALLQGVVQPCNHYKKQWILSWSLKNAFLDLYDSEQDCLVGFLVLMKCMHILLHHIASVKELQQDKGMMFYFNNCFYLLI